MTPQMNELIKHTTIQHAKDKVFYGQEPPEDNLLPLFEGSIIIINKQLQYSTIQHGSCSVLVIQHVQDYPVSAELSSSTRLPI